jgi:hypothetical protein
MVSSFREDEFGKLQTTALRSGKPPTHSAHILVEDGDAHHDRAVEAGAKVVYALRTEGFRRPRLRLPGPRRPPVELRNVRSLEVVNNPRQSRGLIGERLEGANTP